MWRVVATTVAFTHNNPRALEALNDFLAMPTRHQFELFDDGRPSVDALVTETIRLYPPTRRIARNATPSTSSTLGGWLGEPTSTTLYADIGAVHRDTSIWGPDAAEYKPMRHQPGTRTPHQTQALLGFGMGKLKCVASSWAPQAVGIIVAALCEQLDGEMEVVAGEGIGGREGWDGWKVKFA